MYTIRSIRAISGADVHLCLMQRVVIRLPVPFLVGGRAAKPRAAGDGYELVVNSTQDRKSITHSLQLLGN